MKWKLFIKIVFGVLAGGCVIYGGACLANSFFKKKENKKTKVNSNSFEQENVQDSVIVPEQKYEDKRKQAYGSMNQRNEMAKEVLTEIHADMEKSEENINQKKSEIDKMMEKLKK